MHLKESARTGPGRRFLGPQNQELFPHFPAAGTTRVVAETGATFVGAPAKELRP